MPAEIWVALVVGVAIFIVLSLAARLLAPSIARRVLGSELALEVASKFAGRVLAGALVLLGLFVGLSVVFRSEQVALTGVILGTVVASIGVQDLLRNYVSGFYVLLERNIRVGDVVTVGGMTGTVTDIRLRVSSLRAEDGALVVVPNSELFNSVVQVRSAVGGAPERAGEPPREAN